MKLVLVRHGESEDNNTGIIGGNRDSGLTSTGQTQIHALSKILADKYQFTAIQCSPRKRTVETASILQKDLNLNIDLQLEPLLTERDFGLLTGKKLSEINFEMLDNAQPGNELKIEPLSELNQRMISFLEKIKKSDNSAILVVSHSNPIRMLICIQKNISFNEALEKYPVKNGEYFEFELI